MKPKVICVIMGGGRGTRLYPLTKSRCKPAVPLGGKYRLVDIPISNCLNSGFNRIYVLSQFNTASLHQHIQQSYKFDPFGGGFVDILSAEQTESGETWYQGTADAVRQNLHHFELNPQDFFVILSGDQLYRMNIDEMVNAHKSSKADVTIAAKAMPKDQVKGLGIMRVKDDLQIEEFVEKPTDPAVINSLVVGKSITATIENAGAREYCLASMGIYVFNASVLVEALNCPDSDFGKEIIPSLLGKKKLSGYVFDGYWEDIGTVKSFFDANLMLTDPVPAFNFFDQEAPIYTRARYLPASKINGADLDRVQIADGCIFNHSTIIHSSIGVRSVIGEGSVLENVVMMGADYYESLEEIEENIIDGIPSIGVGKNCKITNAIIDKNARIGNNVVLNPAGKEDLFETESVFVRDGLMVVLKNAIIPDGTVIA